MSKLDLVRRLRSTRARAALSLGVVLAIGATGTFASWSDSATVTGTTITTGSLDLKLNIGGLDLDAITNYNDLDLAGMVPGNSVAAIITVKNLGSVPFKWRLDSTATNLPITKDLAAALTYSLFTTTASAVNGTGAAKTCPGTAITGGSGAGLNGTLLSAANGRTLSNLVGSNADKICIQISLPTGASTLLQGAQTDVTLNFTGDQLP